MLREQSTSIRRRGNECALHPQLTSCLGVRQNRRIQLSLRQLTAGGHESRDSITGFGESLRRSADQPSVHARWEQSFLNLPKRGENSSKVQLHPSCLEYPRGRDHR